MKLKVQKAVLLGGLQTVQNVVPLRGTLPILSNVLMTAEKDKLLLATTDIDLTVCCEIQAEVSKTGSSTLPARRLGNIVRELPDSMIEIEIDDRDIASINCDASFFKIIGLSVDEFPPVSKPKGEYCYRMDQALFKEMLKKISYAASTDETRYVLNGVMLSFKTGKLAMVATDGRRLALVEHEMEFPKEADIDVIVPSKTVTELMHILGTEGELSIYVLKNQIMFDSSNAFVCSKLIEGTYPNYKQVIPQQCDERITIERESLLAALRRVALLTTDRSNAARLTFTKNKLTVAMNTPDVGEARETIPVKYVGKEMSLTFNPEYMIDPLKNLSNDEIFMEFTDELSPGLVKCDFPFLYVLMPMRLS